MSTIDWDQRILCPDGACTGLIGGDGVCKVCGRAMPNWGDERMRGLQTDPTEDVDADEEPDDDDELAAEGDDDGDYEDDADDEGDDAEDEGDDSDDDDADDADDDADTSAPEWTERKLCDDGACVGVIATDGICTVCGKRSAA